jgi:hypothetical protein
MFQERPFSSRTVLCRHFQIGKGMCLRALNDKLGLEKFHLRWVPHALSINQESEILIFEAASNGTDGTEEEWLLADYHRG